MNVMSIIIMSHESLLRRGTRCIRMGQEPTEVELKTRVYLLSFYFYYANSWIKLHQIGDPLVSEGEGGRESIRLIHDTCMYVCMYAMYMYVYVYVYVYVYEFAYVYVYVYVCVYVTYMYTIGICDCTYTIHISSRKQEVPISEP